ncbi:hypothetical protein [Limimaricola sp. AA108-03]|uniref:hypothetical protein n=1 Tax=Limimaricola sp. AA108-03 TaxID=3425945 RepID=UPI003D789FC7
MSMSTSAQVLNEYLTEVNANASSNEKFLSAAARYLNYSGDNSTLRALNFTYSAVSNLIHDFDRLNLDEDRKGALMRRVTPFNGLLDFSHMHFDINSARNNFLKPDVLNGLTSLHVAMRTEIIRPDLPQDLYDDAKKIEKSAVEVENWDVSDDVRVAVSDSLVKVSKGIKEYDVQGGSAVAESFREFIGVIFLSSDRLGKLLQVQRQELKRAIALVWTAMEKISKFDKYVDSFMSLAHKASKLIGHL